MNAILMIVVAVVVILLVFVMFSLEDEEDREIAVTDEVARTSPQATDAANSSKTDLEPTKEKRPIPQTPSVTEIQVGSSEDLKFRLLLDDQLPPPTVTTNSSAVVAVVQIRFAADLLENPAALIPVLGEAEQILSPAKAPFTFSVYPGNQMDRLWLFGMDENKDDALFEALVSAFDAQIRFKKALESSPQLLQAKARIAIGISAGEVVRIIRGPLGPISHAGKAVFLAETLAENAGDFLIYVDEQIHKLALPLFDFREWKPTKLRSPLPPISFYEVMGWNKKEEIFAFVAHKEAYARKAVAIAYRYLEFDDLAPLLSLLADSEERVALETLKTIAEIGDERTLGILKKILPEAKNAQIRSSIIEAFGAIGKDENVPTLLASTKDVNWQVRFQAVRALYRICKKEALKHLEPLKNDEDGAVKACVHKAFFQESKEEQYLTILNELLYDLSHRARKAAVDALMEIGTDEALLMVCKSFLEQEGDLRKHILRLLMEGKSPILFQCFLNIFQMADEKERPDIVAAVRRANLAW